MVVFAPKLHPVPSVITKMVHSKPKDSNDSFGSLLFKDLFGWGTGNLMIHRNHLSKKMIAKKNNFY